MEIVIKGRNMEVPEEVREYLEKKIGRLSRHGPDPSQAVAELAREDSKSVLDRMVVEVTLNINGILLRGEERAPDFYTAIDAVANVLDRQIERYKGKHYRKNKSRTKGFGELSRAAQPTEMGEGLPQEAAWGEGQVVKVKRFSLKPMDEEEAALQMELLGHNFFLFLNSDTGRMGVIYRRKDGNYGLIDPDLP